MSFRALPGFRDFYPEEMARRRHIESAWHTAAKAAGFEEFEGPPLESLELLKAKSGDAIAEQLYAFTDKGGREVTLRPELTPTVARMVAERASALRKPIKWYATPQLFRYERQQRGRLREHIQWNVDVFGADEVGADAELLAVALDGLEKLGLTSEHVYVRISDRRLVERKLDELGIENREAALGLIDKELLNSEKAAEVLDEKQAAALGEWVRAPFEQSGEFGSFLQACDDFGLGDYLQPDKNIVRGLAYYTGIVWEIFDRNRSLRAVAGGGRYDTLIERMGGPAMPALGFGMGDVVLGELLKDHDLLPAAPARIDVLVVPLGADMLGPARQVARTLRRQEVRAEAPYAPLKLGKAFKLAEQSGATRVYIVGPDEWANGEVRIKDLESGDQQTQQFRLL
ncbi:MAG: histidine--tRNA ligase [Planctomycetota bacterium]|jgi:histidyl-tRNA synthetase